MGKSRSKESGSRRSRSRSQSTGRRKPPKPKRDGARRAVSRRMISDDADTLRENVNERELSASSRTSRGSRHTSPPPPSPGRHKNAQSPPRRNERTATSPFADIDARMARRRKSRDGFGDEALYDIHTKNVPTQSKKAMMRAQTLPEENEAEDRRESDSEKDRARTEKLKSPEKEKEKKKSKRKKRKDKARKKSIGTVITKKIRGMTSSSNKKEKKSAVLGAIGIIFGGLSAMEGDLKIGKAVMGLCFVLP